MKASWGMWARLDFATEKMNAPRNVKLILVEPYFDLKTPQSVARETGGQVVVLMPSVGGDKDTGDYIKLFDYDVNQLVKAFQQTK